MIQSTPNTSYLRYNAPSGAILPEQQQIAIKDSFNQTKDDNPALKAAENTTQDPKVLIATLGFWGFLRVVASRINKAISGEYKDSMLGKLGATGDKISKTLHLDNFSKPGAGIKKWAKDNRFFKYFSTQYKTTPKNTIAAAMAKGTVGELAQDASQVLEACKKQGFDLSRLFPVKDAAGNIIGSDLQKLNKIIKNPMEHTDDLIAALRNVKPEESIKFGGNLAKRKVYFSELANKLTAITEKGATSGLGKTMSKGTLRGLEGLTNGMAGGPWAILLQAFCFAQATKAAIDAPKGEKLSTFMENVTQDLGYYLVGMPSLDIMHRFAGNKYRGMTAENLAKYKDVIKNANSTLADLTLDVATRKEARNIAKKEAKALLKGTDIKFWEKPLKFFGKILASGLDKFDPIIKQNDGKILKTLKKIGNKAGGFSGGLGRLAIVMLVLTPALVKPIVKVSHMIFGRPTKSVLDKNTEEKAEAKPATNPQSSTNYLDMFTNSKATSPQASVTQPTAPAVNSAQAITEDEIISAKKIKKDENSENKESNEVVRTYIPSSVATQFPDDNSNDAAANMLLQRSEAVERDVLKNL